MTTITGATEKLIRQQIVEHRRTAVLDLKQRYIESHSQTILSLFDEEVLNGLDCLYDAAAVIP